MKITRSRAIRLYCLDCAGESSKEVTLCHIASCPLWQYRFGNSLDNKFFLSRMNKAKTSYPKDFTEMLLLLKWQLKYINDIKVKAYVAKFLEANNIY